MPLKLPDLINDVEAFVASRPANRPAHVNASNNICVVDSWYYSDGRRCPARTWLYMAMQSSMGGVAAMQARYGAYNWLCFTEACRHRPIGVSTGGFGLAEIHRRHRWLRRRLLRRLNLPRIVVK